MKSEYWGPHSWIMIHSIAYGYPDKPSDIEQQHAVKFIESLQHLLPCRKCRFHLAENLKTYNIPEHVRDTRSFFRFTVDLHNIVNKQLDKPIIDYDEAERLLKTSLQKTSLQKTSLQKTSLQKTSLQKTSNNDYNFILLFGFIAILVYCVIKK